MGGMYHNGHFYGGGTSTPIQSDPTATSLDANSVPTGATHESVLNNNFVNKNWTKKAVSLQNSALNVTNSIAVSELETAEEIIVCASNQVYKHNFIHVDNISDYNVVNFDNNNATWRLAFNVMVNWSAKTISIVTYYKGGNQVYPLIDAVYYR